jgi:hypothetical protein
VQLFSPSRLGVNLNVYQEQGQLGPCQSIKTEIDVTFTAKDPARIIAIGYHSPGTPIHYQNGNSNSYQLGTVGEQWVLTGTHKKSDKCPADTLSQDRIEIYTDIRSIK